MRLGICGGTFDPFHRGHLDPILAVRDEMQWDRVLYVPAFVQPFKRDRQTASPYDRFAMTVLGTEGNGSMYVSSRELERGAVSYTIDTLHEIRRDHPSAALDWIVGDDNLDRLGEWKSLDEIFSLANFVVLTRAEGALLPDAFRGRIQKKNSGKRSGEIIFASNRTVPVSSTEIRTRIGRDESIDDLVPPPVSRYIHHYGLYRKDHS